MICPSTWAFAGTTLPFDFGHLRVPLLGHHILQHTNAKMMKMLKVMQMWR